MKNRNWLNVSEYLVLFGAGVGTVASVASQQILFTAAPMSVLFLLNLVNRRRLEEFAQTNTANSVAQLDQKLSHNLSSVQQQVQALPNFLDLASLRKAITNKHEEALRVVSDDLAQFKQERHEPDRVEWQRHIKQEISQLQEHYSELSDSVSSVTGYLNRLSTLQKVETLEEGVKVLQTELSGLRQNLDRLSEDQKLNNARVLQDQINHLNRRLNKLPTPFDASALKQDLEALVKMMGDMASRRELARMATQIEQLANQHDSLEQTVTPLKVAISILKKQLEMVATKLQITGGSGIAIDSPAIDSLRATVHSLEQRLHQIPATSDLVHLRSEVQGIVNSHLGQFQQELNNVQQFSQNLDRQQRHLRDWVNRLPQVLDTTALQSQVKYLLARMEWTEGNTSEIQEQVDTTVKRYLEEMNHQFQTTHPVPEYELVFDVTQGSMAGNDDTNGCSRAILYQALAKAQARLIIVLPFPTPDTLNAETIEQFKLFLDRQGCLDIGWGHLGDVTNQRFPRSLDRRRSLETTDRGFLYDTLNQLTQLKRQYPEQFRFKVLGTDENFLVCDRSYAILGSQSMPTASAVFPQAVVGLRTTNSEVIQGLVDRFDDPQLESDNVTSYFNRAATRYDLGDRQGAIADYTEVLRIKPGDDVAYNNRGLARYEIGDKQGAMADFDLAVQHNPENFIAYCNRGLLRSELGDKLGAIEDYTYAIQIEPDYTTAYLYRGLARTKMQNRLGAIADYTEVIRLNPEDAIAYFYRGLACIKIGHRLDAIRDLRQAAELFSVQGDQANYQQTLSTLKKLHKTLVIAGSNQPLVSNGV